MSKDTFTLEEFNNILKSNLNKFDNVIVLGIDEPLIDNDKKLTMGEIKRTLNSENYQQFPLIIVDCDEFLEQATMCGPKLNFIIVEGQENERRSEEKDYTKSREEMFSKCKRAQQTRANIQNYTTVINFIKLSKPKEKREESIEEIQIDGKIHNEDREEQKDEQ